MKIVYKCECGMCYTEGAMKNLINNNYKICIECGRKLNINNSNSK
ncbi:MULTISPECIES: hypothetical protein [Clostridium]|nr:MULTISPECIES: hypothetical protein [Clostridium]APQ78775.1 hypothetical protein RSJ10_3938 [Clostridium botulinum]